MIVIHFPLHLHLQMNKHPTVSPSDSLYISVFLLHSLAVHGGLILVRRMIPNQSLPHGVEMELESAGSAPENSPPPHSLTEPLL